MSGSRPVTRAVSDPRPPTHSGRRVRSFGAALAGGSPLSSPSPSSDGRSPALEHELTFHLPFQTASSQGEPSSRPTNAASGSGSASQPRLGAFLEAADEEMASAAPQMTQPDMAMESATERELARALRDIAARLPVPTDRVGVAVDEAKGKINAATSDSAVVQALPHQFQSNVRDFLKGYRAEVEMLASARSSLTKLRKHKHARTYPAALNSIKSPVIQFSRAFSNAPAEDRVRGEYSITPGTNETTFESAVDASIKWIKDEVLKRWVTEKSEEVTFLEHKASVPTAVANLEEVVRAKHTQLKARYDYLVGSASYDNVISDVDAFAAMSHALAMTIITKVNSLVLDEEDKRLAIAVKKMSLAKPAVAAASQAAPNDMSELKKVVADLTKQVGVLKGKVCDHLYVLLNSCAGHLSLTRPSLESLLAEIVRTGWEEVERQGQGEERQDRRDRKQKGQKGQSRSVRSQGRQGQGQSQGRRSRFEGKETGQQEERWEEVSSAFGLNFGTDSASACSVSLFGLYDFSELYGLDWTLLVTHCRFLCMSFHPSTLLDSRMVRLVQLVCVIFSFIHADPKINIFDYTTYPDLSVLMEQDFFFLVLSRFAPSWLLGSRRFTNRLHSNLEIEVPKYVIDSFSAGLKYLSPIAMKKSLVKVSWAEFCDRAIKSWARGYHDVDSDVGSDMENDSDKDPFYSLPIPFVLKGHVKPFDGRPDKDIIRVLQAGWRELNSLLSNVPNLDRNNRSVDVESKDAVEWCFTENVLVKPTDKNLGTALVSTAWYEQMVSKFILSNKGYTLISEDEARTLVQRTVSRIRALCFDNSTTHAFTAGNLSRFLGSRLPPPRMEDDVVQEDDWESTVLPIPIFNGLPKIHKSPWGIRPVIPCHSVVQGPVSEFLSCILKTLLADHPQILTSTKELVHSFEFELRDKLSKLSQFQWHKCVFICTADIEGFYTNVPIDDCALKLRDMIGYKFGRDRAGRVKADYISELFSVQQNDLIFRAQVNGSWEYVRQVNGLAMGMPAAPDIANLYAAWYEQRLPAALKDKLLLFKRYIDDIICVVYADSLDHCEQILRDYKIPGLKLNWELSETNAVFLDLDIWRSPYSREHRLKYRPYRKPLNNFERLPWCTGHAVQLLCGAFKSEVHRFAVASWSSSIYEEELIWLKDLYISRGYPPATVIQWTKGSKEDAYKNRLDWVTKRNTPSVSERIWPLKSEMNPVWQKLNLGLVSESMRKAASLIVEEERARWDDHCRETGLDPSLGELPFAHGIWKWFGRLVASQKRPINFGDKENKHNRTLLGILS